MSLIDLKADLRSVTEQLRRIADALDRVAPIPIYRDTVPAEADFSEPTEAEQYAADLHDSAAARSK